MRRVVIYFKIQRTIQIMAIGQHNQLKKQLGEYLVAAELCRRELIAASFSGNIPVFDILAINANNKMKTVQVKTTAKKRGWLLDAKDFLDISISDTNYQTILGKKDLLNQDTIYCFVDLKSFGYSPVIFERDDFYIVPVRELQDIIYKKYSEYISKIGGLRPKKSESTQKQITPAEIVAYKESWEFLVE